MNLLVFDIDSMNSLRLLAKHVSIRRSESYSMKFTALAARWLKIDEARLLGNCAGDARGGTGRSDASL